MYKCRHCNETGKCDCPKCGITKYLKSGKPYKGSGICKECNGKSFILEKPSKNYNLTNKIKNSPLFLWFLILTLLLFFSSLIMLGINRYFDNIIPISKTKLYIMLIPMVLFGFIAMFFEEDKPKKKTKFEDGLDGCKFIIKSGTNVYKYGNKEYLGKIINNGKIIQFKDDLNNLIEIDIMDVDILSKGIKSVDHLNDILDAF